MNHNKCLPEIIPLIPVMEKAYDRIIFEYSKYSSNPLGYADCYILTQAIISSAKKRKMSIRDTIKGYSKNWHPSNNYFVICSLLDSFITLKLKYVNEIASEFDASYEECRLKCMTPAIKFMYHILIARLQLLLLDDEQLKKEENQAWFAGCLEVLKNLKIARKIALNENVNMPIQEAFVDMQIHIINMNLIEPTLKKGFSYDAINFLAFHQEVPKDMLRNAIEPNSSYLFKLYGKELSSNIITRPYNIDPKAQLSL